MPPLRILIVEDQADSAEALAVALRLDGHDVSVAYDGEAGLACAAARAPDVALLDIGLPRLSGYAVAARLRGLPGLEDAFLVALTGFGADDDRARALDAGFDLHFTKPVDIDVLRAELDNLPPPPDRLARSPV
jgi:two-component system CheB/CheR fusion protein